jgi:hypothetical protein
MCNSTEIEDKLSQANGALEDIIVLCTSCVSKNSTSEELMNIVSCIHKRILYSSSNRWTTPSYFRHQWEREQWSRYLNDEFCNCEDNYFDSETWCCDECGKPYRCTIDKSPLTEADIK